MADLRALLAMREPLYALADHTVDTTAAPLHEVVSEVERRTAPGGQAVNREVEPGVARGSGRES